jgi:ribosomal protein S18 acetylase RimI-like enzyme
MWRGYIMKYNIVKINEKNYNLFDDMIFWRVNGIERNDDEKSIDNVNLEIFQELNNSNLHIFAIEIEHKFVAWISLIYLPKVGKYNGRGHIYVDELWVQPSYRRKGFAKELLKKAEELAIANNVTGIRLYVNKDNPTALNLYKECGFKCNCSAYFMERDNIQV